MINIPKGTKDVLPSDSHKWQYVEKLAAEICRKYNVKEIRTPVFEHTELFVRSIGEATDVVGKEMYTFEDKSGRSLTLKPEGTAPVARSFIENSLDNMSLPLKLFYFTPVFRYERPQAGRYRQHHQFGIEIYGDPTPQMDAETIKIAVDFLTGAGLKNVELNINSIGCSACRQKYIAALKAYLLDSDSDGNNTDRDGSLNGIGADIVDAKDASGKTGKMCGSCRQRIDRNPLRILDCKEDVCRQIVSGAPLITDYLCTDCATHFIKLQDCLKLLDIAYKINPWIVRGLDYYTRTVFEFVSGSLGAQGTVCGGGRYDNLISEIGGKPTPCVGFGLGIERLLLVMEADGVEIKKMPLDYYIIVQSPECLDFCVKLASYLRDGGFSADTDFTGRSLKSQFKYAEKQNATNVIVIGCDEMNSGEVEIKRLSDGSTARLKISDITKHEVKARQL